MGWGELPWEHFNLPELEWDAERKRGGTVSGEKCYSSGGRLARKRVAHDIMMVMVAIKVASRGSDLFQQHWKSE